MCYPIIIYCSMGHCCCRRVCIRCSRVDVTDGGWDGKNAKFMMRIKWNDSPLRFAGVLWILTKIVVDSSVGIVICFNHFCFCVCACAFFHTDDGMATDSERGKLCWFDATSPYPWHAWKRKILRNFLLPIWFSCARWQRQQTAFDGNGDGHNKK